MTSFSAFYPGDTAALLAANVLVQIAVVAALAWAIASVFGQHHAAMRHGIWLTALGCVLVSPVVAYMAAQADLSLVSLRLLPESRGPTTSPLPPGEGPGVRAWATRGRQSRFRPSPHQTLRD